MTDFFTTLEHVNKVHAAQAREIIRLRAELERVRGAMEVALAHFDVGETDAGKDVLSSALEGEGVAKPRFHIEPDDEDRSMDNDIHDLDMGAR